MPVAASDSTATLSPSLDDLVALDPTICVEVGNVHAAPTGGDAGSGAPSLWIWSTGNRFTPRRFQESTLDASIAAAHTFLSGRFVVSAASNLHRALRTKDEQEGGIIIPDYMY